MSNATSGSFSPGAGDLNDGVSSFALTLDGTNNSPGGVTPAFAVGATYTGMTVYNRSATQTLRVAPTLSPAAIATDSEFLVPPNGVASISFDSDVIIGVVAQYVTLPVAPGVVSADTLTPIIGLTGTHQAIINLVNQ